MKRLLEPALVLFLAAAGCAARQIPDIAVEAKLPSVLRAREGAALLIFTRAAGFPAAANIVYSDGKLMMTLPESSYSAFSLPPGAHHLVVFLSPAQVMPLHVEVAAGRVYAVDIIVEVGALTPRFELVPRRAGAPLLSADERAARKPVVPGELHRAQTVFDETWDVRRLLEGATATFGSMSEDQRRRYTLRAEDGVDET